MKKILLVPLLFSLAFAAILAFTTPPVRADEAPPATTTRTAGTLGCFGTTDTCARVIFPAGIGGLNLKTNSVQAGAFPAGGVGLAMDFFSSRWYQVSPGVAVTASAASGDVNYANIAGIVGVFRYFWVGTMVHVTPDFSQWYLLGGVDPMAIAGAIGSK